MTELVRGSSEVAIPFHWRDRHGGRHLPSSMETRHLFFTLRMIWNHRMPQEARIEPYRRWELRYSDEYLSQAIRALMIELNTRKDLMASWAADLQHMEEWLACRRTRIEGPHPQLESKA